jgi:hypothetical protein
MVPPASTAAKTPVSTPLEKMKQIVEPIDTVNMPAKGKSILQSSDLMIRDEPWGNVIGFIPPGTTGFDVFALQGDFFEGEYMGKKGYSHINFISVPGHTPSGENPPRPPGAPPPE